MPFTTVLNNVRRTCLVFWRRNTPMTVAHWLAWGQSGCVNKQPVKRLMKTPGSGHLTFHFTRTFYWACESRSAECWWRAWKMWRCLRSWRNSIMRGDWRGRYTWDCAFWLLWLETWKFSHLVHYFWLIIACEFSSSHLSPFQPQSLCGGIPVNPNEQFCNPSRELHSAKECSKTDLNTSWILDWGTSTMTPK